MKRHGNLFAQIVTFPNLMAAARQAQRGKRFRENILIFNYHLEAELFKLKTQLETKTYCPGQYKVFEIKEPKTRLISAAPYRDRVVHHALCNIIVPIFERTFTADSYANRIGFGTHRALRRFTHYARANRYVLQCDLQKYFPSIDHEILKALVRRKIKCSETLWLIDTIIDHSNEQEPAYFYFTGDDLFTPWQRRHGIPIGNLSSQFFANVYLNGFDHFVKEQLKISNYVRYVDDFALFANEVERLKAARIAVEEYLATLRVKIHPIKSQLFETKEGANFLGFRVFPKRIRVRTENLRRARCRLRWLQTEFASGKLPWRTVSQSVRGWIAHLKHGDTWRLREQIFKPLVFKRNNSDGVPEDKY